MPDYAAFDVSDWPRWRCHKVVRALKIESVDGRLIEFQPIDGRRYSPVLETPEYVQKHQPKAGGYHVVYEDGYRSWSTAEAFEGGYVRAEGLPAEDEERHQYDLELALRLARLWRAGKLIGGDQFLVIEALLAEVERLKPPAE